MLIAGEPENAAVTLQDTYSFCTELKRFNPIAFNVQSAQVWLWWLFFKATQLLTSSWPGEGAMHGGHSEATQDGKYQIVSVPESGNGNVVQLNHLRVFQATPVSSSSVSWVQKLGNMFLWHILDRQSV